MKLKARNKKVLQLVHTYAVTELSWNQYYDDLGQLLR